MLPARRGGGWLALVFFAWPAVLVTPSGPSMSDSVILAAIRLAENGTFTLSAEPDPKVVFLTEAFDISVHDGHVYSGVGPGATVLAAPAAFVLDPLLARFDEGVVTNRRFLGYYAANSRGLGRPPSPHLKDVFLLQIALVWCLVAPLFAAFAVRLFGALRSAGAEPGPALAVVFAASLGSPALYYSAMYSRQAVAYLFAWHAILSLLRPSGSPGRFVRAGALLGSAVAVDYPAVLLVALALGWFVPRLGRRERALLLAPVVAAGALTALYHWALFGSPLVTPYHRRFWFTPEILARQGIDLARFQEGATVGIGLPSLAVMGALCFGTFKGLFLYCPALLGGLAGHVAALRRVRGRPLHLGALAVFAAYLVFNGTLGGQGGEHARHFWGGLSVLWGPRYLLAVVPFLACGLLALDWTKRATRRAVAVLLAAACAFNVAGTMFSDVILSTNAFGKELQSPLAYALTLVARHGPRVPLLASYGAPAWIQALVIAGLAAITVGLWRRRDLTGAPVPARSADRAATVPTP